MRIKFVFVSALIGAVSSLCLNSAYSAPVDGRTSPSVLVKSKNQTKSSGPNLGKANPTANAGGKSAKASKKSAKSRKAQQSRLHAGKARQAVQQQTDAPRTVLDVKANTSSQLEAAKSHEYSPIISRYAETYGVPVDLAHAVVHHESRFQPNVRGAAGEIGLMQIKLSTARGLGYSGSAKQLYEPATNIQYGMKYLARAHELSDGSTCGTILKYNAGHGAKRMNPTSARYCNKVQAYLSE